MAKMSIGTIFLSETNFEFVIRLKNEAKHKNFSNAVNTIMQHYQNVLEFNQAKIIRIQELIKENTELRVIAASYRAQALKGDKRDL